MIKGLCAIFFVTLTILMHQSLALPQNTITKVDSSFATADTIGLPTGQCDTSHPIDYFGADRVTQLRYSKTIRHFILADMGDQLWHDYIRTSNFQYGSFSIGNDSANLNVVAGHNKYNTLFFGIEYDGDNALLFEIKGGTYRTASGERRPVLDVNFNAAASRIEGFPVNTFLSNTREGRPFSLNTRSYSECFWNWLNENAEIEVEQVSDSNHNDLIEELVWDDLNLFPDSFSSLNNNQVICAYLLTAKTCKQNPNGGETCSETEYSYTSVSIGGC